jgi:hypothetical protein
MRIAEVMKLTSWNQKPTIWHDGSGMLKASPGPLQLTIGTPDIFIGPNNGSGHYVNPDSLSAGWPLNVVDYVDLETGKTHFVQESEAVIPMECKVEASLTTDPNKDKKQA